VKRAPTPATVALHTAAISRLGVEAARAKHSPDAERLNRRLQVAVDKARVAGVGWTAIGDALDMCAGNAYQRYRHRASSAA
jgi:transcriptional/translational regulatory protein YebC/TACO1